MVTVVPIKYALISKGAPIQDFPNILITNKIRPILKTDPIRLVHFQVVYLLIQRKSILLEMSV